MDEQLKKRIHDYIDGHLDEESALIVKARIKTDAVVKDYFNAILKIQRKVKRLESKQAFNEFKERWPKRVRSVHKQAVLRRRVMRYASSFAAVLVIAIVSWQFLSLRGGLRGQSMAALGNSELANESAPIEMMDEAAAPMAKEAEPVAELMLTDEQSVANDTAERKEEQTDMALEESELKSLCIITSSINIDMFYDDLLESTKDDAVKPVFTETAVSILLNEENITKIVAILEKYELDTTDLVIGHMLVVVKE